MCVFRYIELGVGPPTLFNPPPAPFLLCFGIWKCGGETTHPSNLCIRATSPVGTLFHHAAQTSKLSDLLLLVAVAKV